jgi:hypothetical protein
MDSDETLRIQLTPDRKLESKISRRRVEIGGFSRFNLNVEGTQLTANEPSNRKLTLDVGIDGSLSILIEKVSTKSTDEWDVKHLLLQLPAGYELFHQTLSAKMISGQFGKYYHFKNRESGDFVSFNVNKDRRPYRIPLGRLADPASKIRTVLDNLPDRPFKKAALVHVLPQNIVENRQPIKAALDILEKEGYVKKLSAEGPSEQYVRTDRPAPALVGSSTLMIQDIGGDNQD